MKNNLNLNIAKMEYFNILNKSPYGIIEINTHTKKIPFFNQKFLNIIGYPFEKFKNLNLGDLIHPDDRDLIFKPTDEKKIKIRVYDKNGRLKLLSGIKSDRKNENGEICACLWLKDISKTNPTVVLMKKFNEMYLQQIQKESHDKTNFMIKTMSENLRNIFNSIINLPSLIIKQSYSQLYLDDLRISAEKFVKDQFIFIIGKYDTKLGPIDIYTSIELDMDTVKKPLLNDAFFSKDKNIMFLPYKEFYSQVYKFKINDPSGRGGLQTYALIFIRNIGHPFIPIINFEQIKAKFFELGTENILRDNKDIFHKFFENIKNDILPLNPQYIFFEDKIKEIQKSYDHILNNIKKKNNKTSAQQVIEYIHSILNSFNEVIKSLYEMFLLPINNLE